VDCAGSGGEVGCALVAFAACSVGCGGGGTDSGRAAGSVGWIILDGAGVCCGIIVVGSGCG